MKFESNATNLLLDYHTQIYIDIVKFLFLFLVYLVLVWFFFLLINLINRINNFLKSIFFNIPIFLYFPKQKKKKKIKSIANDIFSREIIVYSQSTINACSFLLYEWWVPLIKFMVEPTIHVRWGSTHLWYSEST